MQVNSVERDFRNEIANAQDDPYQGNGYEFSIKLANGRRLFVHVTRAGLEFLAGHAPCNQLSTLTRFKGALRERALLLHASTGAERMVLTPADLAGPLGTSQNR